jgi:hypothetical protein
MWVFFLVMAMSHFTDLVKFPLNYESSLFSVVLGDFNSDTKLDFAVLNEGTDSLEILLQTW